MGRGAQIIRKTSRLIKTAENKVSKLHEIESAIDKRVLVDLAYSERFIAK